jgi:tetratricopeptide (TPR) repeat protein
MADLQPLLRRLTDLWLGLAETAFNRFSESREAIWTTLVEKGKVKELLRAGSAREFLAVWNLLVFDFPTPKSRSGVQTLGGELSRRLFPKKAHEVAVPVGSTEETESMSPDQPEHATSDHEVFERVKKQIAAIAKAISEGRDTRAERFLHELIQDQTSCSGGEARAVKSLCNIAQRCAAMFRMDFEAVCLKKALELDALDAWALIQYGDHLKRVGNYEEALKVLAQAEQLGESDVARSSMADVYSQQGDYEKAISAYKAIPDWSAKAAVRTAIADNLRRIGRADESEAIYN